MRLLLFVLLFPSPPTHRDPLMSLDRDPSAGHDLAAAAVQAELKPPFTFALYGDTRDGHEVHAAILGRILRSGAKFVVSTGDLAYSADDDAAWNKWLELTKELRAKLPLFAAKGNHDDGRLGRFEAQFKLDKPYYDRVKGPLHFVFLDTNDLTDDQITWMKKTAGDSKSPVRIAVMHHPCFTLTGWRAKEAAQTHDKLHALLRELKFDAVFCGHDHSFYSTVRDDLRYVVTGGGGAPLYDIDEKRAQKGDLFRKFNHYLIVTVDLKKITAAVFDRDGKEAADLRFTIWEKK